MENQIFFALPDNPEVRKKLVESIPKDWKWFDGVLHFPPDQEMFRDIAYQTGYLFSRLHDISPVIVGKAEQGSGKRHLPDLSALMVDKKLPSFVAFEEAGRKSEKSFEIIRKIAAVFLRRGYVGHLSFVRSAHKYNRFNNSVRCDFRIYPHGGEPSDIKLVWSPEFGGNPSQLEAVLTAFYSLGLERKDIDVRKVV
ncbi:MAG: hypothetical protein WC725_01260 [Patescibacteria group bacterium]|jgi:hypothetical protein